MKIIRDYLLVHYVSAVSSALDREARDTMLAYWNERCGIEGMLQRTGALGSD
ncbi:MAG: hypothetical protein HFH74_07925 [Lachnospiraceae bacterium]|nr:hypothetical protein [Lachnospiraceae bacterium]